MPRRTVKSRSVHPPSVSPCLLGRNLRLVKAAGGGGGTSRLIFPVRLPGIEQCAAPDLGGLQILIAPKDVQQTRIG